MFGFCFSYSLDSIATNFLKHFVLFVMLIDQYRKDFADFKVIFITDDIVATASLKVIPTVSAEGITKSNAVILLLSLNI